jgi:hypothetical protein
VRLDVGRTGIWPQSIGPNSADKYVRPTKITASQLELLESTLADEIAKLPGAPKSVRSLAEKLGLL